MDADKFRRIYDESRNGFDEKIRHPLARRLVYSSGVQEIAETGCYWLLDVIGTEHVEAFLKHRGYFGGMGFIRVKVADSKATIKLERDTGEPSKHTREIEYTDMPEGEYTFYLIDEGSHILMHLPTEY
jgi:hypothetical protein